MDLLGASPDRLLPQLESSVLGRHVLAAEDAATMRALLGAVDAVVLPTDGTTDVGPLIQKAYDDGADAVRFSPGRTYLWNTPVFLDRNAVLGGFVLEGNRATVVLGPDLPTTDWLRDGTTRFAIFPNTLRSARSGGAVSVSSATRATGTQVGAIRPLTVRDLTIDGSGTNRGFSFGNRCGVTLENVIVWRARVGATWFDYSDGNTFLNCYSRWGGAPAEQAVVEQVAAGDGILISGGKADTPTTFARLKHCRGALIQAGVTMRIELESCAGIVIQGTHWEGQASTKPMLTIRNSQVTLTGCVLYETYDPAVGCIALDDSASSLTASDLTLNECVVTQLITPSQRSTTYSPFLTLQQVRAGTRVTARGLQGKHAASGSSGELRDTAQPTIATAAAPLRKALSSAAGRAALATGDFTLRRTATTWQVRPLAGVLTSVRQGAPAIAKLTTAVGMRDAGTLAAGATYSYAAATIDAFGNYSKASVVRSTTVGASGMLGFEVSPAEAPGTLAIWRGTGTGVLTKPDRWVVFPVRAGTIHLYDTGTCIGGRRWAVTKVPVPATVAATNRTRSALLLDGKALGA